VGTFISAAAAAAAAVGSSIIEVDVALGAIVETMTGWVVTEEGDIVFEDTQAIKTAFASMSLCDGSGLSLRASSSLCLRESGLVGCDSRLTIVEDV